MKNILKNKMYVDGLLNIIYIVQDERDENNLIYHILGHKIYKSFLLENYEKISSSKLRSYAKEGIYDRKHPSIHRSNLLTELNLDMQYENGITSLFEISNRIRDKSSHIYKKYDRYSRYFKNINIINKNFNFKIFQNDNAIYDCNIKTIDNDTHTEILNKMRRLVDRIE